MIPGLFALVVFGLLAGGAVRFVRGAHGGHSIDPAVLTRQLVFYGLLYVSMILTATGLVWVFDQLANTAQRSDNRDLAQALSLVVIGLPVFGVLLAFADRRLRGDVEERESVAWSAYLTFASITALIMTMVGAFRVIVDTTDSRTNADFEARNLVLFVIWAGFFITHWVFLRTRHGIRGDLHLAIGSVVGLIPFAIGLAGLLAVLATRLYDDAFDRRAESLGDDVAAWFALFLVGGAVWLGIWIRQYESAPRTEPWYITVLPIGTLAGFVAVLFTTARLAYLVLVWAFGEMPRGSTSDHFDTFPALVAIGATGAGFWLYHRSLLSGEAQRTDAIRSYDYALMGASLVVGAIGAVLIIADLLDDSATDPNGTLAGITVLIVSGSTWAMFASKVVGHEAGEDGLAEIRSSVRRSYLYATLGVAGLAVLIAGISALEGIFEDALDSNIDFDTVVDHREQLAIVLNVGAILWFHALILRSDHRRNDSATPPAPSSHWPSRIVVLGGSGNLLNVSEHPGTTVEYWNRTDTDSSDAPDFNMATLDDALSAQLGDDVLVILDGDTPTVIPFER
jgi:hypothetical protein